MDAEAQTVQTFVNELAKLDRRIRKATYVRQADGSLTVRLFDEHEIALPDPRLPRRRSVLPGVP